MVEPLQREGLKDLAFLAVTATGPTWSDHAEGFEQATFPVLPAGSSVFYLYGTEPQDTVLIDKQGRLVSKNSMFSEEYVDELNQRIRELHAE